MHEEVLRKVERTNTNVEIVFISTRKYSTFCFLTSSMEERKISISFCA